MTARDVGVVILAAGKGERTGGEELKQFRWIAGKPMLLHSVQLFQARPDVAMVVCVLPREYAGDPPPWLFQSDTDRLLISVGGKERGDSVVNGMQDLPDGIEIVVIHDAARPFVTESTVDRVIAAARSGTGAIAALPVVDTIKRVEKGRIVETLDRSTLWRAQTPQAFPRTMIERAYSDAAAKNIRATDDAVLCELLGLPVTVVAGSERGMKITSEEDFARAEALSSLPE